MLHPGLDEKGFQHPALARRVLEDAPAIGAIAPALVAELLHGGDESFAIAGVDPILDGDQYRPLVTLDVMRHDRFWPVHRWRLINAGARPQLPAPGQGNDRDRA